MKSLLLPVLIIFVGGAPSHAEVTVTPAGGFVAGYTVLYDPGDMLTVTLSISNTNLTDSEITGINLGLIGTIPVPSTVGDFGDITITRQGGGVVYGPAPLLSFGSTALYALAGAIGDRTVTAGGTADFDIDIDIDGLANFGRFNIQIAEVVTATGDVSSDNFTAGPFQINGAPPPLANLIKRTGKKFSLAGTAGVIGLGAQHQVLHFWLRNQGSVDVLDQFTGCTIVLTDVRGFIPRDPLSSLRDMAKVYLLVDGETIPPTGGWTFAGGPDAGGPGASYSYGLNIGAGRYVDIPARATENNQSPEIGLVIELNAQFGFAAPGESGAVQPGDAFTVEISGYTQLIDVAEDESYLFKSSGGFSPACITTPIHEVLRYPDTYMMIASSWRDIENSSPTDGTSLDRITWFPIIGLHAISGPALPTRMIDRIDLRIQGPRVAELLSGNSPFAPIDGFTAFSGIQVRKNSAGQGIDDDNDDVGDGEVSANDEDEVSFISRDDFDNDDMLVNFFWSNPSFGNEIIKYSDTEVVIRLNFAGVAGNEQARSLPTTPYKKANTNLDITRGTKPDFWIGIIPADSAVFGETFVFSIDSIIIGSTPQYPDPIFNSPASAMVGPPAIFENFVGEGQFVAANSPPQVMVGISSHDANLGAHLSALQFYVLGDSGLSFADFLPMNATNPESSGFAIYRDADGVTGNGNGSFERGVDSPIAMRVGRVSYEALPWNSIHTQFGAENGFRVFMELDTAAGANPRTLLPKNNAGANAGSDYFIVARTSSSASSGRRFRIVLGEMEENDKDGILGYVTFETSGPTFNGWGRVFSRAFLVDGSDTYRYGMPRRTDEQKNGFYRTENNFRTGWLTVGGAIGATYVEQIAAPRTVYPGDSFAAFGVNAFAGTPLRINSIMTDVINGGGGFDSSGLHSIAGVVVSNSTPGGVAFYIDTLAANIGQWNSATDLQAPAQITRREAGGILRCTFTLIPTQAVPTLDTGTEAGSDFFITLWLSDSVLLGDSFYVRMPDSAIRFSDPGSINSPPPLTTPLLTVGMPFIIKPVLNRTTLPTSGDPVAVLGFSAQDTTRAGSGSVLLSSVTVDLEDVDGSGFSLNSLATLSTDTLSGVSLWYDRDSDGLFNKDSDLLVSLANAPTASLGKRITLTVANQDVPDVDPNFAHDTMARFFVVVRAESLAAALTIGHRFTASLPLILPQGCVQFTAPVNPNLSLTTPGIEFAPAEVNGSFTPYGYGRVTTAALGVSVGVPDSWYIRFYNQSADTVPVYRFPSGSGVYNGSTDTLVLNQDLGPRVTGVYKVELIYLDTLDREQAYGFGGQTLTVDSEGVPPGYDSSYILASPTTNSSITLNILIDTTTTTTDSTARLFGEASAAVEIFVLNDTTYVSAGSGTFNNYRGAIVVALQSGVNPLYGVTTDSFGNRSDTVYIVSVQRNVGANVLDARLHPEFRFWIEEGETIPVFSINLTQNNANEVINAIRLVVSETVTGAFTFGKNIASVSDALAETAGIQLWRDKGTRGSWDSLDERIRLASITRVEGTGNQRALIELIPEIAIPVPVNDTEAELLGDDLFITIAGGFGALFRDSFILHLPANAFVFAGGARSNVADTIAPSPIRTRVERNITTADTRSPVPIYPAGTLGSWTAIFALDLNDSTRFGDGAANLSSINLTSSDSNAYLLDFRVFKDNRGADTTRHGLYTVDDTALTTSFGINSVTSLTLNFSGDTSIPHASDSQTPDFFLAVRVKPEVSQIEEDINFSILIPRFGVSTTGDSPGGWSAEKVSLTIKAGRVSSFLIGADGLSRSYFNPYGRPGGDTLGFVISPGLPRAWRVMATRVTDGLVYLDTWGYSDSAIVLIDSTAALAGWPGATNDSRLMSEYRVHYADSITYPGALSPATIPIDTSALYTSLFFIDSEGLTPRVTKTSQTGATLIVNVLVGDGGDLIDKSRIAAHQAERDNFSVRYSVRNSADVERIADSATSALGATDNSISLALQITVVDTDAYIIFTLTDALGNVSTETRFIDFGFFAASGEPLVQLGDLNEPVFRWSAATPNFTFTFPTTATNGRIEIVNTAGRRITLLPADGSNTIVWRNALNSDGEAVKNGVYFVRYDNIVLSNGQRINGRGAILLLK